MCAPGKTLIDSYSHMLKRLQLLAIVSPKEIDVAFADFDKKYAKLISNIKTIIRGVLETKKDPKLTNSEFKLFLLTKLDGALKTEKTGFYDIHLSPKEKIDFNEQLKKIFTPARVALVRKTQANWTEGGFVLDSKDKKLYPVGEYAFNYSKKREFYGADKKLTPYRINVHNTIVKGQRSSTLRGERYLADGEYTEANRRMKEIGIAGVAVHADHFIPLALGGVHDAKNLRSLPGPENIYKKDKLTEEGFELLKQDINYLSHRHWSVFNKYKNEGLQVVQEALRNSVAKQHKKILDMSDTQKSRYIQHVYPTYKESQIRRIIRKHFTLNEDQSL